MSKINTHATGHGNKIEHYGGGVIPSVQFNVFPNTTTAEKKHFSKLTRAYDIVNKLDAKIDLQGPCNKYFKTLPRGKTFRHFWRDNTIFINYSPSVYNGFFGATHTGLKDICITAWCLDNTNHWMIAATIVHEFAHIAGAPGGLSHAAEKSADMCGFKTQYDPLLVGSIKQLGAYLENVA